MYIICVMDSYDLVTRKLVRVDHLLLPKVVRVCLCSSYLMAIVNDKIFGYYAINKN